MEGRGFAGNTGRVIFAFVLKNGKVLNFLAVKSHSEAVNCI